MKSSIPYSSSEQAYSEKEFRQEKKDGISFHIGLKREYPISRVIVDLIGKRKKRGKTSH